MPPFQSNTKHVMELNKYGISVSYTHLDVYKRQPNISPKNVNIGHTDWRGLSTLASLATCCHNKSFVGSFPIPKMK